MKQFFHSQNIYQSQTLFIIVFVFLATLKSHRTYMGQGDEPHYIVVTESLLRDQDLDLANNYSSPGLRSFDPNDHHVSRKREEHEYPHHSLGLSILGIPILALSYVVNALSPKNNNEDARLQLWINTKNTFSFSMMLWAGGLCLFLYHFFQQFFKDARFAWWLALITSLTPPLLSYGFLFFSELPTAFLVTLVYSHLARGEKWGLLDSLIMGFLPWLHVRNYLVAGTLFLLFSWAEGRREKPFFLTSGLLFKMSAVLFMWLLVISINLFMWKGISPEPQPFQRKLLCTALPGLFLDRSFGLFIFSPITIFFPAGLALLFKVSPRETWQALLLIFGLLLPLAGFPMWWGGWSPGPRFLTPAIPLLSLGVGQVLYKAWQYQRGRKIVYLLFGLTFILSLLYWQDPRLLWNHEDGVNKFLIDWFGPVGRWVQSFVPDFFSPFPGPQVKALVWILLIGVLNLGIFWRLRSPNPEDSSSPQTTEPA